MSGRNLQQAAADDAVPAKRATRRRMPALDMRARCAIAGAVQLVGDQWTLVIIRDLLRGYTRFGDLAASAEGISRTMLSERLKLLETEGIVERSYYSEHPPRAEYRLTSKGRARGPALGALARWGARYLEHDTAIVSAVCGHELSVAFECPVCDRRVSAKEARIAELGPS
ncbi:MAG: winged helix-turn-helix transcriptional regulator [Dehalococcoidia bacterium]